MLRFFLVVLAVVVALSTATAASNSNVLESHPALTSGTWLRMNQAAEPEQPHRLLIALKQRNLESLEDLFWAVSNPKSSAYGKYLTQEELRDLVGFSESDMGSFVKLLEDKYDATDIHVYKQRDVVSATFPASSVEKAFGLRLEKFQHAQEETRHLFRSLTPMTIPEDLAAHVDLVKGLNDLPLHRKRVAVPTNDQLSEQQQYNGEVNYEPGTASVVSATWRGNIFTTQFIPVCLNGKPATQLPPCDGLLSGITLLVETISDVVNKTMEFNLETNDLECKLNKQNVLQCSWTSTANPPSDWFYHPWKLAVGQSFQGAAPATWGYNAWPVVLAAPVTPAHIRDLYNIPASAAGTNSKNSFCVVEFEQQYYSQSDLIQFMDQNGLPRTAAEKVNIIGPNTPIPGNAGVEANLDIQYAFGIAPTTNMTYWSIKARSSEEIDDILAWSFAIGNATAPPLVNSLSYGMAANQVDKFLGAGYLHRSNVEFQKLALLGISVLIASGDTGSGDLGPPPMSNPTCGYLHPDWPSESPYITSVGSTLATKNHKPICYASKAVGGISCEHMPVGEVLASLDAGILFTSGSGFSNHTSNRPAYQTAVVDDYLKAAAARDLLPPAGIWNAVNSRGYPDVVTLGHNFMVVANGVGTPVDGTSASAPTLAGILALLNDARLNSGKPALGFINPLIYQIATERPGAFNQVVVGNSRGGAYGTASCAKAFQALPGTWNAAAGLGSPNFAVLLEEVLKSA